MRPLFSVSFRRSTQDRVESAGWEIVENDVCSPLPTLLTTIDYSSTLRVRRELVIDVAGIRADCGIPENVPLLACATWHSNGTALKRTLCVYQLDAQATDQLVELGGQISCGDLAGSVDLVTSIIVATNSGVDIPLVARLAGSILFQDRQAIEFDDAASFFPVEVVDFESAHLHADAGWMLVWNVDDLDQPFLSAVRLYINATHTNVVRAVTGSPPSPEAAAIRTAIYFDVAKSLILGALDNEDFVDRNGDYPKGSCGKAVYDLIRLQYSGDTLQQLVSARKRSDWFNAELQHKLRVFWD
jgi:hypothetical protein